MQRQWPSTHQGRHPALVLNAATAVAPASAGTALQQRRPLVPQQVPAAAAPAPPDVPAPASLPTPAARHQQHAAAEAARMAAAAVAPRGSQVYIPAATPLRRAMQLTAHIRRRRHWSQLQNIWLDNSSSFSTIHLTATLTRLAQLVAAQGVPAADGPELFKFSSALMSCVHQRLAELDPRGAAQCLHAYAKLQACCPHHSSSGDAAADGLAAALVAQHMPLLQRQELSQAAWAAAMLLPLGLRLPVGWWAALEQRLLELLPVARPAEVACCAWAMAKAQHAPSPAVVQALLDHVDSRHSGNLSDSTAQEPYGSAELLQLLLAVAAWKQRPSEPWLLRAQQRLQQQAPGMSAQDVSNTLLAAARLGFAPSAALLGALLQRLQQQLPHSCPRVLATVPYALARLSLNPGQGWWAGFLPYTAVALRSFSPTALALTAWSLARLGVNPGQPWLQELLSESRSRLRRQVAGLAGATSCQGFAAQELALLAWALGKWGASPQPAWWQAFEAATAARLDDFTAAELGALLCGMGNTSPAQAGVAAQPMTARTTLAGMLSGTGSSSDSDSDGSSISGSWGPDPACRHTLLLPGCPPYSPSAAWAARLLQASEDTLPGAPAGCLAGILMGLAKLGIRPGSAWLGVFQAAAMAALPQATLRDVAALLWGFAVLQVQPSSSLMQETSGRISQQLQQARQLHLWQQCQAGSAPGSNSSSSSSSFDHSTRSASGPAAAAACASPTLSLAVAAQLLWSLANLPLAAEAAWLDELLAAVRPELPAASSDTLVTLLWGLARLRHVPGCPGWLDCWWDAYASQLQAERALPSQPLEAPGSDGDGDGDGDDPALVPLLLVLSSFRRLRAVPSPGSGWLSVLLDAVGPHLPTASSAQLCLLLGQLVGLHVWPGEAWLAAAVAAVQQRHCGLADAGVERLLQDLELLGCARVELDREACLVFE